MDQGEIEEQRRWDQQQEIRRRMELAERIVLAARLYAQCWQVLDAGAPNAATKQAQVEAMHVARRGLFALLASETAP